MDDIVRKPRRSRFEDNAARPTPPLAQPVIPPAPAASPAPQDDPFPGPPEPPAEPISAPPEPPAEPPAEPPKPRRRLKIWKPKSKKQWILVVLLTLLLIGAGGGSAYALLLRKSPPPPPAEPAPEPKIEEPPKPTTEASRLSGVQISPEQNLLPILSVMIENSPDARPQSGLLEAGIVFEAIAEGGITRFNALYQESQPEKIGPIRSLRPYYIDWFKPFDAAIAHVGGSPEALSIIRSAGHKDIDQFQNSKAYYRDSARYAPHNMYASSASLRTLMTQKGFTSSTFTPLARKAEAAAATPTAKRIDLDISSFYYDVAYDYNPAANNYLRSVGGKPHMDASGTQLSPKVVIAVVMERGLAADRQHTKYTTVGSGKLFIFQDGAVQEGTWRKTDAAAQWQFQDNNGEELPLNPGQTWISMVDMPGSVTYKP